MAINFKPSIKQDQCFQYLEDNITSEVFYGGAAGGGKSYLGCAWHIIRRLRYPETRGLIGRDTLKNLKETTLVTFLKVCKEFGLQDQYKYNQNEGLITWSNGSQTLLKELSYKPSDPDYQRLGGLELTDVFIDEGATIPEKAFDILNTRVRWKLTDYNIAGKIFVTCNPGYHWIRERYVRDDDGNDVELKEYQQFVYALATDNPDRKFREKYIKDLEKIRNPYDKARLLYGDWDAQDKSGAEFYKEFDHSRHVKKLKYNPELPLHLSFDFNTSPYITLTISQVIGKEVG